MKKAYWVEPAGWLIVFLVIGAVSTSIWASDPPPDDHESEAVGFGGFIMPYPTHMELILDRFLKDPGRFIGMQVNPDEYIVGPGDVFTVSFMSDDIGDIGVRISATGTAFIKSVGVVRIDGLTLRDALTTITTAVNKVYTRGNFEVQLAAFRLIRVDVIGEVADPGTYYVPAFWRTSEVIELAGGLTPRALSRNITLQGNNRLAQLDMVRFETTGDISANPMISGGHTVIVPNLDTGTDFVTVTGLVHRPGTFAFVESDLITDYLRYAGGVLGTLRDTDIVISNPSSGKAAVLSGSRASDLDIRPNPGDNIVVRWKEDRVSRGTVMIFGAVERPGRYALPDARYTVQDLLAASGGIAVDGCQEMMQIFRKWRRNGATTGSASRYNGTKRAPSGDSSPIAAMGGERSAVSSGPRRPIDPDEFTLVDGDSVYVPHTTGMVSVVGAVASPGLVLHKRGQSVDYYVGQAGGLGFDADPNRMVVVNPTTGSEIRAAAVDELFDGEIIFVPRKESNTKP
jgi:protein involved in polysaccharide export with SLBB domain